MKNLLLLCFSLLIFFACKNEKTATPTAPATSIAMEKNWNMSNTDTKNIPPEKERSQLQRRMTEGWFGTKGRIGFSWSFFEDGTLMEFAGQTARKGTWKRSADDPKTIEIDIDGANEIFKIQYLDSDSLQIEHGKFEKMGLFAFKSDGANYPKPELNPYHPANNLWRWKPAARETDEQLRARLKNHLHHLVLILEGALEHKLKVVSFRASPSNVHQFNGGVGVEKWENLPEAWFECFYDKEDAKKANKILEEVMQKSPNVKLDANEPWLKKNLMVLKSMESSL